LKTTFLRWRLGRLHQGFINLFRAADDIDPKWEWEKLALSGLSIRDIPGEHLEILAEPNVQVLAREIQLALSKCFENKV